jgi:Asp-tRNA(Asn)/Glu-tRNA(Gln) amidotransferase A subunit family amidase
VPAGFNKIVYEPAFALNAAKDNYVSVANETVPSMSELPLPVGISFWAAPGDEPVLFKAASAYEAATKHRKPAAAFGPVSGQP